MSLFPAGTCEMKWQLFCRCSRRRRRRLWSVVWWQRRWRRRKSSKSIRLTVPLSARSSTLRLTRWPTWLQSVHSFACFYTEISGE